MRFLSELLTRNWMLKLAALALAILLWTITKSEELTRVEISNIPVEVVLRDPGWSLAAPPAPATATVVFSGPLRELVRLAVERPRVVVTVEEVEDSMEVHQLRTGWVQLDGDLARTRIEDVRPSSVLLFFERLTTRLVPVAVRTRGELPAGTRLAGSVRAEPAALRVSGPVNRLAALDSIPLVPVDLAEVRGPTAVTVPVDTTGLEGLVFAARAVDVIVPAAPEPPPVDTAAPPPDEGRSAQ